MILVVLIGILIGLIHFYYLFSAVQKWDMTAKTRGAILGQFIFGLISVVGIIFILWIKFHMNPIIVLSGVLIGKFCVFGGVKKRI